EPIAVPKPVQLRRVGDIALGDLVGRLEVFRVACSKCERVGRYHVAKLVGRHGANIGLPDLRDIIAADCPRQVGPGATWDLCAAFYPDLPALMAIEGRP